MGADNIPGSYGTRWSKLVYTEAFKRLGIPLQFEYNSPRRRSMQADSAGIDGEIGRVLSYGETHPNLIRVEEAILELNFVLYTANPAVHLQRLEDLPATNLVVEYRRGIVLCENTLKQMLPLYRISEAATDQQGMKKLLAHRTDLYCEIDTIMTGLLHSPEFKDVKTVRKVVDLGRAVQIYPYLHKKHAELVPRLAATLKKMKAEGLMDAYRIEVEREMGWRH